MIYTKGVRPSRVPDALTLKNHRISLKSCVYERVAEGLGALPQAPIRKFCHTKLALNK
ncbi:hypothetical protein [uncultured Helicobacter sp.]|uniref:hypothetical protein n=1 Tax=uncultured Helicobacter sp. TaxID=175537 RepID=UPI0037523A87